MLDKLNRFSRKVYFAGVILLLVFIIRCSEPAGQIDLLVNHLGYSQGAVKKVILFVMIESEDPPEGSRPVSRNLHFGTGEELIANLAKNSKKTKRFRVYAGYAGWAPGQLDHEIKIGGWYVAPADAATVFSDEPAGVWSALISTLEAPPPNQRAQREDATELHAALQGWSQVRGELE